PDGKTFAVGSDKPSAPAGRDKLLHWYDLDTGEEKGRVSEPNGRTRGIAFTRDGKRLLACGWAGGARLWDLAEKKELRAYPGSGEVCHFATFSPDEKLILVACGATENTKSGTVLVYETDTGKLIQTLSHPKCHISHATFSHDGKRVVGATHTTTV